jgi:predicted nucleic acid-binding protein
LTVVLDSWAVIAFLEGSEPAAPAVRTLLDSEVPIINWINLGEVYYITRRNHGEPEAASTVRDLQHVLLAEVPTPSRVMEAGRIKADHRMSYADAFAAATAAAHDATLWTGDPELLLDGADWKWRDLRR